MKTRTKVATAAEKVPVHKPVEGFEVLNKKAAKKKKVAAVAAEPVEPDDADEKPRGGFREGAGRPAYLKPEERKKTAAYMSTTEAEKKLLERRAEKEGLTLSYYMRKRCGLSISA